jgi:hypothetical protein
MVVAVSMDLHMYADQKIQAWCLHAAVTIGIMSVCAEIS